MTLLLTSLAAVTVTVIWYVSEHARNLKVGMLCYMFWGASLMWLVDAAAEYLELGADYFTPEWTDMVNDAFLGVSVIGFALVVWVITLLVKDPKGVIRAKLNRHAES